VVAPKGFEMIEDLEGVMQSERVMEDMAEEWRLQRREREGKREEARVRLGRAERRNRALVGLNRIATTGNEVRESDERKEEMTIPKISKGSLLTTTNHSKLLIVGLVAFYMFQ